jgi:hypothetical protein
MPASTLPTSRASPSMASPRISGVMPSRRAAFGGRRFEHLAGTGDQAEFAVRQTRVARLRRFQLARFKAGAQFGGMAMP